MLTDGSPTLSADDVAPPDGTEGGVGHAAMQAAFDKARRDPVRATDALYVFAGRVAAMRVIGDQLAATFDRPLAHLRVPAGTAPPLELTIDLWDEASTGVPCPLPPPMTDPTAVGVVEPSADGRFVSYARAGTRFSFDRARRHIVGWVADGRRLTQVERGRPFMGPLHLWHQDRDVHAVHAGLVARDGRGILFGGAGGSGKTTSALSCLQAGFTYFGDDYVGLETRECGRPFGHSVYCSTHVAPGHLQRFGDLVAHAQPGQLPTEDKSLVCLSDIVPERLGRATALSVLVLPRVVGHGETVFRRASSAEALLRIAPSSVFLQRASIKGRRALDKLEHLVRQTPAYWLELGRDLDEIPARVGEILEEVAS